MTPEPMSLERALEVAIEACEAPKMPGWEYQADVEMKAAARLRAALPFLKDVEEVMIMTHPDDEAVMVHNMKALYERWRAMKEGT